MGTLVILNSDLCILNKIIKGTSSSDTTEDPNIGPYNVLECRPGTSVTFATGTSTVNGLVIAMHFKPLTGQSNTQTIWAIRNTVTNVVSLTAEFIPSTKLIKIYHNQAGTWVNVISTTAPLTLGNFIFRFKLLTFMKKMLGAELYLNWLKHSLQSLA